MTFRLQLSAEKADAARRLVFSLQASQATRRPKAKAGARTGGTAREAAAEDAADVLPTPEVRTVLCLSLHSLSQMLLRSWVDD